MMKYSLFLLVFLGCASDPISIPVSIPKVVPILVPVPVPPSAKNPCFYQGYAAVSQFNGATHRFECTAGDSVTAQIRVVEADDEMHATVSVTNGVKPFEVFLFLHKGYYISSDSLSYAYFSATYDTIVWGQKSQGVENVYQTIYAIR